MPDTIVYMLSKFKVFCEPLLAVWSPEALEKLAGNVKQGLTGPRFVLDQLSDARIINPESEVELFNVNTVEEWEKAVRNARAQLEHQGLR